MCFPLTLMENNKYKASAFWIALYLLYSLSSSYVLLSWEIWLRMAAVKGRQYFWHFTWPTP